MVCSKPSLAPLLIVFGFFILQVVCCINYTKHHFKQDSLSRRLQMWRLNHILHPNPYRGISVRTVKESDFMLCCSASGRMTYRTGRVALHDTNIYICAAAEITCQASTIPLHGSHMALPLIYETCLVEHPSMLKVSPCLWLVLTPS